MLESLPSKVKIVEVGPRDGLQNEEKVLPTSTKLAFLQKLIEAGITNLEVTSFVNPKAIPQMADAKDLYQQFTQSASIENLSLQCLVPNEKGLDTALEAGVTHIAVFTATSETFNQKNINASIEESMERIKKLCARAKEANLKIRGYVSTAFGCPYEGKTSVETLISLTQELLELGAEEVSIGDTIGVANPLQVTKILRRLLQHFTPQQLAIHMHDTRGTALANVLAALDMGITTFDSSAGGLGGCPYAPGASGNLATEDLVYMLQEMGVETGIDLPSLAEASRFILKELGHSSSSKALQSL